MNTGQIFRESVRILTFHPTRFHSISMLLFSPLSISLFISHLLMHHFPNIPSIAVDILDQFPGQNHNHILHKLLSKTIIHIVICFPSSITFSLLGRAATIQAVSDSYNRVHLNGRQLLLLRSSISWVKLIHTSFWEYLIILSLFGFITTSVGMLQKVLFGYGICSREHGFWIVLGFLGIPFCVSFAHVMVMGNLARVLSVLENECYGFESLLKARNLIEGRKQTALVITLLSNGGFRLVDCLFELRIQKGISLWEGPMLISMYSSVLVLDTVMNVVFYYTCKPRDCDIFRQKPR